MAEEVLIDVKVDDKDSEKKITDLTTKIVGLQNANKDLQKEQKALEKSGQQNSKQYIENAKQIELNKQKISENNAQRKSLIKTMGSESNSINALKKRNAELIKQRDKINTSTEEGRKKIDQLNKQIDANNAAIQGNVSGLEKQKINIGNYASALDGIVPGLGRFTTGIQSATVASTTFIATPLGAVLGAIGLALAALISYFKGSEEGQNDLIKVTRVFSVIMGNLGDIVQEVGKYIFEAIENPQQALKDFGELIKENLTNRFNGLIELIPELGRAIGLLFKGEFSEAGRVALDAAAKVGLGVENISEKIDGARESLKELIDETNKEIAQAQQLASLEAATDVLERQLIVQREILSAKIAELRLRAEDRNVDINERIAALQEAQRLQNQISAEELRIAKNRANIKKVENSFSNSTKEDLKEQAELEARVFSVQRQRDEANRRAFTREQALREEQKRGAQDLVDREREAINAIDELRAEQAIKYEEDIDARLEKELELEQIRVFQLLENQELLEYERQLIIEESQAKINDLIVKADEEKNKKILEQEKKAAEQQKKIEDFKTKAVIGGLELVTKERSLARVAGNVIFKQDAIKEVFVNTRAAAIAAYKALSGIPIVGPALGVAAAGAAIAYGASQLAAITGITFARGGMVRSGRMAHGGVAQAGGILRGPSHRRGGIPFSVGGRVGFEAEGGEAIINKRSTAMFRPQLSAINQAGGGVAFATGGITGDETRIATRQAEQQLDVNRLGDLINRVQTVLVLEDFETKTDEVGSVQRRARVIE